MFELPANAARFTLEIADFDGEIHVVGFTSKEQLSQPFEFKLKLASEEPEIAFEAVLNQPARLTLYGDDEPRTVHALIRCFEQGDEGRRFTRYRAILVPRIWYLDQRHNCRIFQQLDVPQIIEQVLKDAGFTGEDYRFALQKSYAVREYCVQYRESELNFISRLMEEAGISYFFEHGENNHVLVMCDGEAAFLPIPGEARLIYHPPTGAAPKQEHIFNYRYTQEVGSGAVTTRDYHFKKPALDLQTAATAEADSHLERYDYPGRYDDPELGQRLAQVRLEGLRALHRRGSGKSDCVRLQPGFRFTLADHPRDSFNQTYLVTALEQTARQPQVLGEEASGEGSSYDNEFVCIPADVPYRPPEKATKPVIEGAQTALVVGPEGEEIYTDEHARVKVSFHWDREGEANEKSSCWIRVSQAWAGPGCGAMSIPRIGQEVVVDFLEGDPDRPIITGRVYHGTNRPPFALPLEKTKSTLKSNSSKGGGGFNEIRLEDKKGEEQIFVHAEKDQDIRIKNDRFEWIGHNRHLVVKQDKFEQVENNRHRRVEADSFEQITGDNNLSVGGKQAISVDASHSFTVSGDVIEAFQANHTEQTSGDYTLKAKSIVLEAPSGLTLACGGGHLVIDPAGITLKGAQVTLDGDFIKIASGPGSAPVSGSASSATLPIAPQPAWEADNAHFRKSPPIERREAVDAHGGDIGFANALAQPSPSGQHSPAPPTTPASRPLKVEELGEPINDAQWNSVQKASRKLLPLLGRAGTLIGGMAYTDNEIPEREWIEDEYVCHYNSDDFTLTLTDFNGVRNQYNLYPSGEIWTRDGSILGTINSADDISRVDPQDDVDYRRWVADGGEPGFEQWKAQGKPKDGGDIDGATSNALRFTSAQADNLKDMARTEFERLNAAKQAGQLTNAELGPALSVAQDMRTGQISHVWRNNPTGEAPVNLSETLARRWLDAPDEVLAFERTHGMASHAEIYAVDELLKARPDASLSDFAVFTMETRNQKYRGEFKPACLQCNWLLEGVQYVR